MSIRPVDVAVEQNGQWGVFNRHWDAGGRWSLRSEIWLSDLVMIAGDGKLGFVSKSGETVHECIFDAVNLFYDYEWDSWRGSDVGYYGDQKVAAVAVCREGKWGFIARKDGHWISPCQWEQAEPFYGGLSKVRAGWKWGAIDGSGRQVIACEWDEMTSLEEADPIRVRKREKWLFLNRDGTLAQDPQCEYIGLFDRKGLAPARKNGKWGYQDRFGTWRRPVDYPDYGYWRYYWFDYGLARVKWMGKVGLIDFDGNEIIPCQWDNICVFSDRLLEVARNYRTGFLCHDGTEVYPCRLERRLPFFSGMAIAKQDGKWGIIDEDGHVLLDFRWDYVTDFRKYDLALVRLEGKWGLVDRAGTLMHPCTLEFWEASALREKGITAGR